MFFIKNWPTPTELCVPLAHEATTICSAPVSSSISAAWTRSEAEPGNIKDQNKHALFLSLFVEPGMEHKEMNPLWDLTLCAPPLVQKQLFVFLS